MATECKDGVALVKVGNDVMTEVDEFYTVILCGRMQGRFTSHGEATRAFTRGIGLDAVAKSLGRAHELATQ